MVSEFFPKAHMCCTRLQDFYAPEYERTIAWDDPDLSIDWELEGEPIVSAKDRLGILFRDAEKFESLLEQTI